MTIAVHFTAYRRQIVRQVQLPLDQDWTSGWSVRICGVVGRRRSTLMVTLWVMMGGAQDVSWSLSLFCNGCHRLSRARFFVAVGSGREHVRAVFLSLRITWTSTKAVVLQLQSSAATNRPPKYIWRATIPTMEAVICVHNQINPTKRNGDARIWIMDCTSDTDQSGPRGFNVNTSLVSYSAASITLPSCGWGWPIHLNRISTRQMSSVYMLINRTSSYCPTIAR